MAFTFLVTKELLRWPAKAVAGETPVPGNGNGRNGVYAYSKLATELGMAPRLK